MKRTPWPWILLGIGIAAAAIAVPALGGVGASENAKAPTLNGVAKQVKALKKQVAVLKKRGATAGPAGAAGAAGPAGARGPSTGLQARQSGASLALGGTDATAVTLSLPSAGTYVLTARAGLSSQANPVTATCTTSGSGLRGGAQMTFSVGTTQIETGSLLINPNVVAFGDCIGNAVWEETAVVTISAAKDVTIKGRDTLVSNLTDNSIGGAAITAVQVDSATGATVIP